MSKESLIKLIDEKINEVFLEYQNENNIQYGDITPWDDLRLDTLKDNLAILIIEVCEGGKVK